ncbi:MAG: deoxyribodipyrimidine photolyase [Desulfobulbus propionicus]|nr:MAG: deoxyribodipyrimidine photolyase [Desulfobulbus propionicus]
MNKLDSDITRRGRELNNGRRGEGPVVYWMSRDQRVHDNWALLWAQQEALIRRKGVLVIFCLVPDYPGTASHHYGFMLRGLACLKKELEKVNIHFLMTEGQPTLGLPAILKKIDAHLLVCDFDPLRIKRQWQAQLLEKVQMPVVEVDTHNIIPAWIVSDKKEYAAYTIRPKVKRLLDDYLTEPPRIQMHPYSWHITSDIHFLFDYCALQLPANSRHDKVPEPGEAAALGAANKFLQTGLSNYVETRNNPCLNGQSGLSPYLHFGQLAPQRLAKLVSLKGESSPSTESFLEELIVRRELADNFCLYEPQYDNFYGFPKWARESLDQHRGDRREHIYSLQEFEESRTHEPLWNSCQLELVRKAKLHGYLRMYWAKKILEWTPAPETAMEYAIYLNNRYSLDGSDPNGYTGIAWSIGGVHDRAWKERLVFGKIRYMNESGCQRKFDTAAYIKSVRNYSPLSE